MSSCTRRCFSHSRAAVGMDELFALGVVILLFSSAMAFSLELVDLSQKREGAGDIFEMANDISKQVRSHPLLMVENRPGQLELRRLLELDNESLSELIIIPDNYGFSMKISVIMDNNGHNLINLAIAPNGSAERSADERAFVADPVSIRLNDHEILAAVLNVGLWR